MKRIAAAALFLFLARPVPGQNVFFEQTFGSGLPTTWTQVFMGFPETWYWQSAGLTNGSPDIWYDWYCNNGLSYRNTILRSPSIDLSGLTNATFQCQQYQLYPFARVYNGVKVTTNNGTSYTEIYQETGTWTGTGTIQVSLNAYAGNPNVRLAFHYQGAIANEWHLDDVRILTTNPVYTVASLAAGQTATFTVSGAAPGNPIQIGVSFDGAGPLPTPFGNVNLTPPIFVVAYLVAGPTGQATFSQSIPLGALGAQIYTQAVELNTDGTLDLSNSMVRTIQ
ncbi:MAG TPA: hypothetical protein VFI25_00100 [Planctomycetota bacterium]|jgi:hypothetical protein|nr:hypothetical protein [Planctomycetota bacterium]